LFSHLEKKGGGGTFRRQLVAVRNLNPQMVAVFLLLQRMLITALQSAGDCLTGFGDSAGFMFFYVQMIFELNCNI